jgi:hypothetical protein
MTDHQYNAILCGIALTLIPIIVLCIVIIYHQAYRLGYARGKVDAMQQDVKIVENL